jgi:hypothetical protein
VLAGHEPTVPAILELNLLKQLVVLAGWVIGSDTLSCRKLDVETPCSREPSSDAIYALHAISLWPDGVAALADIDTFEEFQHLDHEHPYLPKLLDNIAQYKAGKPDSANEGVDSWQRHNIYL